MDFKVGALTTCETFVEETPNISHVKWSKIVQGCQHVFGEVSKL